jgi:hypothetical protein
MDNVLHDTRNRVNSQEGLLVIPPLVHDVLPLSDGPTVCPSPRPDGPDGTHPVGDERRAPVHEALGAAPAVFQVKLEVLDGQDVLPGRLANQDPQIVRVPVLLPVALIVLRAEPGVLGVLWDGLVALVSLGGVVAVDLVGIQVVIGASRPSVEEGEVIVHQLLPCTLIQIPSEKVQETD